MKDNNYSFPDFDAELPEEETKSNEKSMNIPLNQNNDSDNIIKLNIARMLNYTRTHPVPTNDNERIEFIKCGILNPTGSELDELIANVRSGNLPDLGNNLAEFTDHLLDGFQAALLDKTKKDLMGPTVIKTTINGISELLNIMPDSIKGLVTNVFNSDIDDIDDIIERNDTARNTLDLSEIPIEISRAVLASRIEDDIVERFALQYASFYDTDKEYYNAGMFTNQDIENFDRYFNGQTIDISKCKLSYIEEYRNKFIVMRAHPKLEEYESFFVCIYLNQDEQFKVFIPLLTNALVDNTEDCLDALFDFSNIEAPKSEVERYGLISKKKFPEFFDGNGCLDPPIDIDGIIHDANTFIVCNDARYPVTMPLGNFPVIRLLDAFDPDNSAFSALPIVKNIHYFYIGTVALTKSPEIKQFCKDYGILDVVDIDLYIDAYSLRHSSAMDIGYRATCKYLSMVLKYNSDVFSKIDVKVAHSCGKAILLIKP